MYVGKGCPQLFRSPALLNDSHSSAFLTPFFHLRAGQERASIILTFCCNYLCLVEEQQTVICKKKHTAAFHSPQGGAITVDSVKRYQLVKTPLRDWMQREFSCLQTPAGNSASPKITYLPKEVMLPLPSLPNVLLLKGCFPPISVLFSNTVPSFLSFKGRKKAISTSKQGKEHIVPHP